MLHEPDGVSSPPFALILNNRNTTISIPHPHIAFHYTDRYNHLSIRIREINT